MYERFYNLTGTPFALTPETRFFFRSEQHSRALAVLRYAVLSNAAITVITGEVGTGKTTLVMKGITELESDIDIAFLENTHPSLGSLIPWILASFGVEPESTEPVALYRTLVDFVQAESRAGRRPILIIDEAQNLTIEALEEVRLLSNLNRAASCTFQIVLVGQPELREKLALEELRQLAQRVTVDYKILQLNYFQSGNYIDHRLKAVGGDPEIFDTEARAAIFCQSHGVPRLINNICHMALAYGYGEGRKVIGLDIIRGVVQSKDASMAAVRQRQPSADVATVRDYFLKEHEVDLETMERVHTLESVDKFDRDAS